MATYTELRELFGNSELLNKVEVAVIVAADGLLGGTPAPKDKAWAAAAFSNPKAEANKALKAVLADNKDNTVAQITGASDAAIQTKVTAVVPVLVDVLAGV